MSGHDLGKIEYAPPLDKVPHSNKCCSLHLNLKKSAQVLIQGFPVSVFK